MSSRFFLSYFSDLDEMSLCKVMTMRRFCKQFFVVRLMSKPPGEDGIPAFT